MRKIVLCARARNEMPHIERFIESYRWVDKIFIADGGSDDGTLEKFAEYRPFVEVKPFTERISKSEDGSLWRNPEGKHVNFVLDWAYSECEPDDWVLLDEPDSSPNAEMRKVVRSVLEETTGTLLRMKRMYVWGTQEWFPKLTPVGDERYFGLWGFRVHLGFHWEEKDPWIACGIIPEKFEYMSIDYPAALLHYFTLTPERAQAKLDFYKDSGQFPEHPHWLTNCGPLERLPDWAKYED